MRLPFWAVLTIYVAVFGSFAVLGVCALWPDTETVPSEEADEIIDAGILAAFDDEGAQDVQDAVATGVSRETEYVASLEPDLNGEAAKAALKGTASEEATEAVLQIEGEATDDLEEAIAETADVDSKKSRETAEEIVQSAVANLNLEPGTLDEADTVSEAATSAVFEAFRDRDAQNPVEDLGLTQEEEERLELEAADRLTSVIVESSVEASEDTVEELPPPVADNAQGQETRVLDGVPQWVIAIFGTFGGGSVLCTGLSTLVRQAFPGPLKLQAVSGRKDKLRYAVASHCTVEGVRLERPLFVFWNTVYEDVSIKDRTVPLALKPDDGEIEFAFGGDAHTSIAPSWNCRLVWSRFRQGGFRDFSYALCINGHWQSYPIHTSLPEEKRTGAEATHSPA